MVPAPVRCDVTGLAHGGAGVARIDGRVVFVAGALPGETVLVQITDDSRAAWWRGHVLEVVVPSPDRTPVSCPAAAAGAGCCDLAFGTTDGIRRAKATIVADALTRIGRVEVPAGLVVEGMPGGESGHRWRIRARAGVAADRSALGFRTIHSNAIVAHRCAALTPALSDALGTLDPADLRAGSEVIAVHDDDDAVHLAEVAGPPSVRGGRAGAQRRRAQSGPPRAPRVLLGGPTARYRVGDRTWELPVAAFWQAHRGAAEVFARTAGRWLAEWALDATVWDLYGGSGVFAGAAIERGAGAVHIVDTEADALASARTTFHGSPVHTHRAAVSAATLANLPAPGIVVLDPPRSGVGNAVMDVITAAEPAAIVHVGCDPAAFARDIGRAITSGYRLDRLKAYDAFPLTHHVEAMALLVRP